MTILYKTGNNDGIPNGGDTFLQREAVEKFLQDPDNRDLAQAYTFAAPAQTFSGPSAELEEPKPERAFNLTPAPARGM